MTAEAFRRALLALTIPLAIASCERSSERNVQDPATIANHNTGQAAVSPPARTGTAQVEGGRIAYQIHGDLNSSKTPLLVLHGSFMSGDTMRPFIDAFAASHPVIAIDARGHGRLTVDFHGPITYELMADDAAAVLAALNIQQGRRARLLDGRRRRPVLAVRHPERTGRQIILAGRRGATAAYPEVLGRWPGHAPPAFAGSRSRPMYAGSRPIPTSSPPSSGKSSRWKETNYAAPDAATGGTGGEGGDDRRRRCGRRAARPCRRAVRLRGGGDRAAGASRLSSPVRRARASPSSRPPGAGVRPDRRGGGADRRAGSARSSTMPPRPGRRAFRGHGNHPDPRPAKPLRLKGEDRCAR